MRAFLPSFLQLFIDSFIYLLFIDPFFYCFLVNLRILFRIWNVTIKVRTGFEPCWVGKKSIFFWTRIGNTEKPEGQTGVEDRTSLHCLFLLDLCWEREGLGQISTSTLLSAAVCSLDSETRLKRSLPVS